MVVVRNPMFVSNMACVLTVFFFCAVGVLNEVQLELDLVSHRGSAPL